MEQHSAFSATLQFDTHRILAFNAANFLHRLDSLLFSGKNSSIGISGFSGDHAPYCFSVVTNTGICRCCGMQVTGDVTKRNHIQRMDYARRGLR
jgi:hypothetical protein